MRKLGWTRVPAFVREDLGEGEAAFGASVLENLFRKTYGNLDRALVVQAYRQRGYGLGNIAELMGLSPRQVNNVEKLLELPLQVQEAIADTEQHFSATHAMALERMLRRYPDLDWSHWIASCNADRMSVAQLERAVRATPEAAEPVRDPFESIFNPQGTDLAQSVVRFRQSTLTLVDMHQDELQVFLSELEQLQAAAREALSAMVPDSIRVGRIHQKRFPIGN